MLRSESAQGLRPCLLLSFGLGGARCFRVKFIRCAREAVGERFNNGWFLVAGHQGRLLYIRSNGQSALRDQFHGTFDRNPHRAGLAVDPRVVFKQQIFARMQVGDILVAVVGLQARSGELLRQLGHLVLQSRAGRQVAKLPYFGGLGPLAVWPVLFVQLRIDDLADAIAEDARDRDEDGQRGEEDHDAGDTNV